MSYDASLYRERPAIKDGLKTLGLSQGEFARRHNYVPSTFTNKINGLTAMDSAEEQKILSDIRAMGEG